MSDTTKTTSEQTPRTVEGGARTGRLMQQIPELADRASSTMAFYQALFPKLSRELGVVYAVMELNSSGQRDIKDYHAEGIDPSFWREAIDEAIARSLSSDACEARVYGSKNAELRVAVIAAPFGEARTAGTFACAVPVTISRTAEAVREQLMTLLSVARLATRTIPAAHSGPATTGTGQQGSGNLMEALAAASQQREPAELAIAMVNQLRSKLQCELVALGKVRAGRVRLVAVSGLAEPARRSPGSGLLVGAMEEAYDLGATLTLGADSVATYKLHAKVRDAAGGAPVATIPLRNGETISHLLTIRNKPDQPIDAEALKKLETLLQPYGAALRLLEQATENPLRAMLRAGIKWMKPRTRSAVARRVLALATVLGLLWFFFGTLTYRVPARTVVVPSQTFVASAAFDGRVAEVYVRKGDRVGIGTPLLRLDTQALEAAERHLQAELLGETLRANQALARQDRGQARIHQAQAEALRAQLELTQSRIARATIVAQAQSIVTSEEVHKLIGQTVSLGTPLMELIDINKVELKLFVSDSEMRDMRAGLSGRFALESEPDVSRSFRVTRVGASANPMERTNVFEVQAVIESDVEGLKPGMQGVARVEVGPRRACWVAFHRVIDKLRLWLWV